MIQQIKTSVSIVIVCMNNLKHLYPCLESIKNYTRERYEILLVAYLFTPENLEKLKADYPWIKIIESNEIKGFSENNNLALKNAKGKYCFVLNDDTFFNTRVIDNLIDTIENLPQNVAVISPNILNTDGSVQYCGRPKLTFLTYILGRFKLWNEQKMQSKYKNKKGIFQTYNVLGAAFLIKTEIFRQLGFFDEKYFFSPEDIALSNLVNRSGYKCYVNESVSLFHIGGGTKKVSKISLATKPAGTKGNIIFYSDGSIIRKTILSIIIIMECSIKLAYWFLINIFEKNQSKIMIRSYLNIIWAVFTKQNPKQIFLRFYKN